MLFRSPTDYACRVGGDEFMVLMPHTRMAEGHLVAERIRVSIGSAPVPTASGPVRVTASLGIARVPAHSSSIDELLSITHMVLSQSKRGGKNRATSDQDGAGGGQAFLDTVESLKRSDSFHAVKQAIHRLADERVVGYEFLTRALTGVFTMPDDFFRVSAETDILTLVDHHCLKVCLAAAAALPAPGRRHLNLLPSTLLNIPVNHILDSFQGVSPDAGYCLELSEQQVVGDPSPLVAPVAALKQAGIRIAIDDVGFGHSCLESLILLEPDVIKIDRHCVGGIAASAQAQNSLQLLLKIAHSIDAEVIAEGIETRADLEKLKALGVEYGQGYLWGRPE